MPTTTGTSVRGLQLLGVLPVITPRNLSIIFSSEDASERLTRIGTVLIAFQIANDTFPTAAALKLYGNGLAVTFLSEIPAAQAQVWVNWFKAGVAWTCITQA